MHPSPLHRQQGAATLATALLLLLATSIMSFALARASLQEQRILQNELRASEALQRAEALLEWGMQDLHFRGIPADGWLPDPPHAETLQPDSAGVVLPGAFSGEVYQQALELRRAVLEPEFIELTAAAWSDSGHDAQVRQYLRVHRGLGRELPPMLLDGCLDVGGGGNQFFPAPDDLVSLATTRSNTAGGCIDSGAVDLQGGHVEDHHAGAGGLWDTLFDIGKAEHRARSDQEAAAVEAGILDAHERVYFRVDDGATQWPDWFGSAAHPVWIVFSADADCPDLPDDLVVYGILYYETGSHGRCDASHWGQVTLYGSLLVEGDLDALAGGGRYHHYAHAHADGLARHLRPLRVARIPGTWRDFRP